MGLENRKFVADNNKRSALNLTSRESLVPNCLVTVLFFLWGFAYGLLDVLNAHFQAVLHITAAKAAGLSAAYFGAYLMCPPSISSWILRHFGFRVTFMTGLAVLAVGSLLFWPSGVKSSFGGFCGSMFIVGTGLSTLETAADPFLAICGPLRYSEIRLNLAQAVQGVGAAAAPLLASRVFFAHTLDTKDGLKNVQWVYLGVAGFVALLTIMFLLAPMPEITDADMLAQELKISESDPGPFRKQWNLFLAVFSQFCYVGSQVAIAYRIILSILLEKLDMTTKVHIFDVPFKYPNPKTDQSIANLFAIAQGLYAVNRFIAAFAMMIPSIKPRYVLSAYLSLCIVFSIAAMNTRGNISIAMLTTVLCFESACFATIFTLGLRGLGKHTKRGGALLVSAISGGMVFPPMMGAVVDRKGAHTAMAIPMMGFILAGVYPVYVNVFKRKTMDIHRGTSVGLSQTSDFVMAKKEDQEMVQVREREVQ
ncbi:hypothetical protein TD95_000262 [Thielaviopsis punctulata]|uniref:Major facilitator superfamily (MFS) profile domain-containing protein n=1 Tax=Thielaviopsis punctulata TaxID=72032 RepID=A0A0F4ZG23_9PEZI|nr:hypothetical protein TD95_000262 [Thielaviopsis punctulata]